MFDSSNKVFVLNNWYKEILIANQLDVTKILVVPQALPVDFQATQLVVKHTIQKPIRLVYVGRICKIKGLDFLLRVLNKLPNQDYTLSIYGYITEPDYYEQCVNISKNNRSIFWHQQISQDDILRTLSQYDAFVFPTMVEEMAPLTIHEAFAAKLPIIGAKVHALMDQIQDGHNGLLFEFKSEKSLEKVLTTVINNPSILESIRAQIQMPPTFEYITQTTLHAYQHK